ncbi:hypothetical protein M9H77_23336 [Catharanthus roseus]|uniref:Uncharacterized protein n=1 Tax=Catharanthus roseus TaxID=4058 RepID=A0ACC0AX47_CATRO|nr:hypothetical protein M9H77_23336 [Catharanthus roseus]
MKANENGRKRSENDENEANNTHEEKLLPKELETNYLPHTVGLTLPLPLTLQIPDRAQEDSYQLESEHSPLKRKLTCNLIMSTDGHMPTQSHQEGPSDPSRMNLNETLRPMQQSIDRLARQFQSVALAVEELKKGKSSSTMKKRIGDNLGGFNSPHYQRPYDNVSTYGYHDIYQERPQHKGGRRGGLGGRGYHRPQEEYPRQEAWHDDNFYEDDGDNPNIGQAYHDGYYGNQQGDKALDKIKWKVRSFKGDSDPNVAGSIFFMGKLETNYLPRTVGLTLASPLQILNRGISNQEGHLRRDSDPILQAQEDSYQVTPTVDDRSRR